MREVIHKNVTRKILLNPGPATTTLTVKSALVVSDICPREKEFGDLLDDVRRKLCKVVNSPDHYDSVLIPGSGTFAVESAIASIVGKNKKLLILINGTYGERIKEICDHYSIETEVLKSDFFKPIDGKSLDEYLIKNHHMFDCVALVHHETTTGLLNDISGLNSIIKKHKLTSIIDCMSSYAGIPIDLGTNDIDCIISSSNKCIQGMPGLGFIVCKKIILNNLSVQNRCYSLDLAKNYQSQVQNKQFPFTPPVQILYALNQALDEFFKEGSMERYGRYCELYEMINHGLHELEFKDVVEKSFHSKILTTYEYVGNKNYDFQIMHDFFYMFGVTIYPSKLNNDRTFRIANIGNLDVDDAQQFLKLMNNYINSIEN